ncbi:wall-associated receptor kinase 2-like [Phragmites australis]|uniref:wall-associated receptor kinase 2-like n=1 Tax=Phragmites australis TaxID=29695 RepID=UPI002D777577|nr:wall-associated receptor kinase 2-like [Phragmites australis]
MDRHVRNYKSLSNQVYKILSAMMIPAASTAATALLLLMQLCLAAAQARDAGPSPGCPTSCGNVSVPYPFGMGSGCYHPGFDLTCDRTRQSPRLLLGDGTLRIVEISLANSTVRAMNTAGAVNITNDSGAGGNGTWRGLGSDRGSTYIVSEKRNQFVVTGCNIQAMLVGGSSNVITGCSSICSITDKWTGAVVSSPGSGSCSGIGCCETPIPIGRPSYGVEIKHLDSSNELTGRLPMAVRIAEKGWFDSVAAQMLNNSERDTSLQTEVPVVLEWAVASTPVVLPGVAANNSAACPTDAASSACRSSNSYCQNVTGNYRSGYVCRCQEGYDGNPYVADGCQDIDECALPGKCFGVCKNTLGSYVCQCPSGAHGNQHIKDGCVKSYLGLSIGLGVGSGAGLLFLVLGAAFVTRRIKNRRARMLRQKFFKQNRGHLLQQLLSQKADIAERMIIPLVELEKATNNFDKARELGGGGHGTVYKGILSDQHVVAIKKSKMTIQREIDEFINEVAILSQINHRNVVRLFGCCLETEVPLLVYEFISNGTLYDHLHVEGPTSLTWAHRLRIATETARSLAYLHISVSFPIIHRDIKSHNILLDGSLAAKVSDFGASRCIPADQTGITTAIQGTLGYLDPMYYYTGRLTEKSDVFSFGVVLIELLTRKKPYSFRSPKDDGLVAHFTALLSEGNLVHILDPQIVEERAEVGEAAALAAACVKLKAEDRPTMRQVEMTLESIASLQQVVMHSEGTKISKEKQMAVSYPTAEGRSREESSRQYSLEEEFLLSARYPR